MIVEEDTAISFKPHFGKEYQVTFILSLNAAFFANKGTMCKYVDS